MTRLPHSVPRLPRLWVSLWAWIAGALLVIWLVLGAAAYYTGLHEAQEITDGQLVSTAELLLRPELPLQPGLATAAVLLPRHVAANGYSPELQLAVWEDGQLVLDSHRMAARIPALNISGHQTLGSSSSAAGPVLRVFLAEAALASGQLRRVAVAIDTRRHADLARDIAEHIVRPALLLIPLVALVLTWVIRRGLRPLNQLGQQIEQLDLDTGQTLTQQPSSHELMVITQAINALVGRLHLQWQRERRFTSDVAHELRTPLTALVWQARLANQQQAGEAQQAALAEVERQSLRAGHILSQLLDMARAQHGESAAPTSLDLCALARQVLSEHVASAFETGHEVSLETASPEVWVSGHAALLELALRNLLDNALRHTAAGTRVQVRVEAGSDGAATLSVNDTAGQSPKLSPRSDGLGIGLTLVRRIAELHGIAFTQGGASDPFRTRFALVWPPSGARQAS